MLLLASLATVTWMNRSCKINQQTDSKSLLGDGASKQVTTHKFESCDVSEKYLYFTINEVERGGSFQKGMSRNF